MNKLRSTNAWLDGHSKVQVFVERLCREHGRIQRYFLRTSYRGVCRKCRELKWEVLQFTSDVPRKARDSARVPDAEAKPELNDWSIRRSPMNSEHSKFLTDRLNCRI